MKISRTNQVLAVLLVVVFGATLAIGVDHEDMNYEFLPDMKYSPAKSAYEDSKVLPDARVLQPPVAGTIARGEMPLHLQPGEAGFLRLGQAGNELLNPYLRGEGALAASTERGAEVFRTFCVCCHGPGGAGDGPVPKRGYPPPSVPLTAGNSIKWQDGQIFHVLALGKGSMPNFAAQLPPNRRWDVINYIRSLQKAAAQSTAAEAAASAEKSETTDAAKK